MERLQRGGMDGVFWRLLCQQKVCANVLNCEDREIMHGLLKKKRLHILSSIIDGKHKSKASIEASLKK